MPQRQGALTFDFGMRHIGVASVEVTSRIVGPKCTLPANHGKPNVDQLDFLIDAWQPTDLVVGLPLNMDSTESRMSRAARKFGQFLEKRFQLPVHFVDERLSSYDAAQREGTTNADHALAAVAIGETWLHDLIVSRR